MTEARKKLIYYNMSPAERYAYDAHLSAIMIQNDVLDRVKLEGRMEGKNGRVYRNSPKSEINGIGHRDNPKSDRIITGRNSEVINEL